MSTREGPRRESVRKDRCSSAVFLLFSFCVSFEAYRLGLGTWKHLGAGYFPFVASVALGVISLSLLVGTFLKGLSSANHTEDAEDSRPIRWQYIVLTIAGMLGYVAIFDQLGFVPSTLLIMVFLVRVVGGATWRVTTVTALSITIASYLLFDVALDARLPKGILEELF